jgi:hypothetical protein
MRSSDSLAHEVQLLLEDEPQVLFEHRVSRSDVKKKSLILITDFFKNSQIPNVGDMILVAAVEECAEWKRYVEQDLEEGEILREMNDIVDEEDISVDEEAIARGVENFKLDGKLYVMSGLQSNATSRGKEMFEFLLPQGEGLTRLNAQNDFKLPWSIYCPVVEGDREIVEWTHNLKRCQWMAPAINKKKQPLDSCNCLGSGCGKDCLNRALQYECSASNCPFKHEDCGNRLFTSLLRDLSENRLYAEGFEIRKTEKKGCGLFSIRPYNAGSLIVEYTGEVVDLTEVEHRVNTIYKNFADYYFLRLERNLVIDAGQRGSAARFVNHSCDANCEMQKWSVDNSPRIGLFAKRQISVGEEITYDYNFEWGSHPQRCFCGAKNCRGFIGRKPDFNEASSDNEADEIISEPRKNHLKKNPKKKKPVAEDEDDSESEDLIFDDALEEVADDGTEVELPSKNEIPHEEDDVMETIEDDKEGVEVAIERSSRKRAQNPEVTHSGKKQKLVRNARLSRIDERQSNIDDYAEVPAKLRRELAVNMVGEKFSENIENQKSDEEPDEEPPVKRGSRSRKKISLGENEVDAAESTKVENSAEPILIEDEPKVMKPKKTKAQKSNDTGADSSSVNENEGAPVLRSRRKTQVVGNDDNEVKFQDEVPRAHSAATDQLRKSRSKTPIFRRKPFLGKKAIFNREVSEKMTKTPKSKSINIFGEDLSKLKKSKRSSVSYEQSYEGKYQHDNYGYNSQGYDSESQRRGYQDGHYQQDQHEQQSQDTRLYSHSSNGVPDSSQQSYFHGEPNNGTSVAFKPDSEASEMVARNSPEFKKRRDPRKRA